MRYINPVSIIIDSKSNIYVVMCGAMLSTSQPKGWALRLLFFVSPIFSVKLTGWRCMGSENNKNSLKKTTYNQQQRTHSLICYVFGGIHVYSFMFIVYCLYLYCLLFILFIEGCQFSKKCILFVYTYMTTYLITC